MDAYRARRPRASPLWQSLHACYARFHLAPSGAVTELAELFRHIVLRRLVDAGIIVSHQARRFLAWRHSGFNVDAGQALVGAADREGTRRLAEYLLRAPFALEKME